MSRALVNKNVDLLLVLNLWRLVRWAAAGVEALNVVAVGIQDALDAVGEVVCPRPGGAGTDTDA